VVLLLWAGVGNGLMGGFLMSCATSAVHVAPVQQLRLTRWP